LQMNRWSVSNWLNVLTRATPKKPFALGTIFQAQMELSIANLESNYLRETSGTGNIIKVGSRAVFRTIWRPATDGPYD
jgi:hypothetical protein